MAQPFGCKRQVIDTGYYITYNRPNVELVDLRRGVGVAGAARRFFFFTTVDTHCASRFYLS